MEYIKVCKGGNKLRNSMDYKVDSEILKESFIIPIIRPKRRKGKIKAPRIRVKGWLHYLLGKPIR